MKESIQNPLTQSQQTYRVAYLAVCFLVLFLSYCSLQNLFSTLCQQYGYNNLGQTAITFIYFAACCSTPLTSLIIKKVGFKKSFFLCSLGYMALDFAALFMALYTTDKTRFIIQILVCAGAFACGFSASLLWVAQGGYVSRLGDLNNKNRLFSLFWSIIATNQIIGNFMGAFLLGNFSQKQYFIVLSCLAILSSILFLLLPPVDIKTDGPQLTLNSELKKIWKIINDKKYKYLVIYFFFPGLSMAFYSGYLYKIVRLTISREETQSLSDYHQRMNFSQGMVFIGLGIAQFVTGFSYRKYTTNFNKFKLVSVGALLVQLSGLMSLICYFQGSYRLCFVAAMLWGASQVFNQTNTSVIVSILFKEKVEGFTVSRIFYCIRITLFLLLNILMSKVEIGIFLTLFMMLQTFGTIVSLNLKYLQGEGDNITLKLIQKNTESDN